MMPISRVTFIIILSGILSLGFYAYNWQSPGMNRTASSAIHDCIDKSHDKENLKINSFNNEFDITYVENSGCNCINPYFPSIHITTKANHNAWLHVVYTDSNDKDFKVFIDTVDPKKYPKMYPFYSLLDNEYREFYVDFYDAPLWQYNLFSKPLSYWKGHAWAVSVDFGSKRIKPVGGVIWGFNLSYFRLRPTFINPLPLDKNEWENDWIFLKTKFDNFTTMRVKN